MNFLSKLKTPCVLLFGLASAQIAQGTLVVQFNTGLTSGSCFANTYNDVNSGCQPAVTKPQVTFSNVQADTAIITWTGFTSSAGFSGGPLQPVNFGRFDLTYTPNGSDTTPVSILPTSFLMVIKETAPTTFTYQTILANLTGTLGGNGSIATGAADLEATFTPLQVDSPLISFFVPPASQVFNGPGTGTIISGQIQDTSAPEPSTWLLLTTALAGFTFLARRKPAKVPVR
jgi:hypothetical protein